MLISVAFEACLLLSVTTTFARHATQLTVEKSINRNSASIKLPLVHRNNLPTSSQRNDGCCSRFDAQMRRDALRAASLTVRQRAAHEVGNIRTAANFSDGEYFVSIKVGSQVRDQHMMMDTGRDLVWVKCQCAQCFEPNDSHSFSWAPCGTPLCVSNIPNSGCDAGRHCTYVVSYAGDTTVKGAMASESISIGNTTVPNVTIGCANEIQGAFNSFGADGLLGLGRGSLSLASQSGGLIGGAFSYCLGSSDGWLEFGRSAFPTNGATWASLMDNGHNPSLYYIGLVDLGVGGERLNLPEDTFRINDETGKGGVVIDTGSEFTYIPVPAYHALTKMFKAKMTNLNPAKPPVGSTLETCYYVREDEMNKVPNISFYFTGGLDWKNQPVLNVWAKNFLVAVALDATGIISCFAFARSDRLGFSIIGNAQQQGIQISIDSTTGYVGFGPNVCN